MTRRRTRFEQTRRQASRRPGIIPGRRFALALLIAGAPLGGSVRSAAAAENAGQTVSAQIYQADGVTTDAVSIGDLAANPGKCPLYSGPNPIDLHSGNGVIPAGLPAASTWSLATVLGCLPTPVSASDVTGVTVTRLDGSPELSQASQLGSGDLVTPSKFANAAEVPVISSDGDNVNYYRPWRGAADNNYLDKVGEPDPSPLALQVFEGPPLTVTATASENPVPAGTVVSFSATVTGGGASALSYTWDFDGVAANSTASAPQAPFDSAGQYDVSVEVTDAAGGGGGTTIPITVNPVTATSPATTPGAGTGAPSGTGSTPTGPLSGGGNQAGGAPGKQPVKATGTSDQGHGAKHAAAGKTTHERKSSTHTSTTPTSANPTTHAATAATGNSGQTGSSGSSSEAGAVSSRISALTPHSAGRAPAPVKSPPTRPAGKPAQTPLVTGRLISDVTLLAPGASPLVHFVPADVAAAPAVRRQIRASLLPVLGAGIAIVLLFGLGARRELRWRPDWRGWRAARLSS